MSGAALNSVVVWYAILVIQPLDRITQLLIIEISSSFFTGKSTGLLIGKVNHTLSFESTDFESLMLSISIENQSGNPFGWSAFECCT